MKVAARVAFETVILIFQTRLWGEERDEITKRGRGNTFRYVLYDALGTEESKKFNTNLDSVTTDTNSQRG